MKKRMLSGLLAFMMSLSLLHIGAFAADMTPPSMSDYETVSISSAEELLKLVSGTDTGGETLGKIYRLGADLTIDTSALETSFWGTSRKFCGVLDGNNHTVTLESNADAALQPLFDGVVGTATTYAGVKNLTLKVTGPVAGTTLAGCISYASIDNVKIEFTTVSFAEYTSDGDYAVATGVFGHSLSGMPSYVTNVAVKGGTIGSEMAQNKQYVLAAGVYTEYNLAGGTIDCRGIKVNVENIYATTSYQATDGDAACCAAGVVSGVVQSNARVANTSVNLTGNIRAIARDGSNVSQVGAYGLGHWLISMYACDVIVGGNIEAEGSDYKNSNHYNSDIDQTVAAAGLGYMVYTKYNNVLYDAADSGVCGVTVGGSIKATGCREKDDSYQYDPAAIAAGTAVWADATYPMKNITVKAETIEAHATNTCAAYANGFAYRVDIGGRAQGSDWNYDFVNCSVDVDTIFSSSVSNTSFATGFIYHGYGTFENCTVNAKTIKSASSNKHAGTVGFNYMFLPITSYYAGESAGNLEKCSVTAESLVANGSESAEVYGLCAAVFGKQYYQVEGNVENCTVKIGDIDISASACNSALLISDNYDCKISENNVTISESVARALGLVFDVTQASDSTETGTYLLYTANEDSGRGRATAETSSDWESGNTVTLLSNGGTVSSVNDIFCRYDNGNTENGTLWKIASSIQYYTVSYDLNGGTVENENDCAAKTVASGEAIIVAAAPTKDDYNFNGWSDGTTTYQPGETLTVAGDVTLTAQWTKISSGDSFGETTYYTLSYESNGGTSYSDELYSSGATVKLDKVPSRENHTFTGWYADETLTERITEIKMNSDKTVYAGWDRTGVPDWLNGEDHFAYVIGYGDGLVRPTDSISRAEVATIFFRLLKQEIRDQYLTTANNFTDVNEGDWYDMAVSTMTSLGILKGRTDTTFEPNAPITRAEFAAVCARFDTNRRNADSNFTDIGSHWAREEIERACALGWINGYEDGTFRPDQYITRAEAMTMINRVLNRMPETEGDLLPGMNTWPDNQPGAWYYLAVQEATNSHEFTHKGEIYESWTVLADDPDWMRYQD